jgi:hypothetical protein
MDMLGGNGAMNSDDATVVAGPARDYEASLRSEEPYALLARALRDRSQAAVTRTAFRSRESLATLRGRDGCQWPLRRTGRKVVRPDPCLQRTSTAPGRRARVTA